MDSSQVSLAQRRDAMVLCADLLRDLHTVTYQCPNGDVTDLAGQLGELAALATAAVVATVSDAEQRGLIAESQCKSTTAWVAEHVWHCRRQAAAIAKTATLVRRPELAPLAESVLTTDLDPGTAVTVGAEYDKLAPSLTDDAKPAVLQQMLDVGAEAGPTGVRQLVQHLLARYGKDEEFEKHQDRCRRQRDLSCGVETSPGVWQWRLTGDNEFRSIMEGVIGPGSAPHIQRDEHGHPTGVRDERPVGQRRAEALLAALKRSTAGLDKPNIAPKAVLHVTIDYEDLRARVGQAMADGSLAAGTPLSPDTVRRLACDATIIPIVLGQDGAVLDQGRGERLFTKEQIQALWIRDGGCTFPHCDTPAAWCEAHHLRFWADGGHTDLENGALLCGRHHTIVHRDKLAGKVVDGHVEWDLTPGSYRPGPGFPTLRPEPPEPPHPFRNHAHHHNNSNGKPSAPARPQNPPADPAAHPAPTRSGERENPKPGERSMLQF